MTKRDQTPTCEECGNHSLRAASIEGRKVFECELCGRLSGRDDDVVFVERVREARARGIDPEIYDLVTALDAIRGVHVEQSSGGDPELRLPPYVRFIIGDNSLTSVDNIAHAIELAQRSLAHRWIFKAGVGRSLYFELLPAVDASALHAELINELRGDTARLAACFNRDRSLSWWKK